MNIRKRVDRLEMSWRTKKHDARVGDDAGFIAFDDEFVARVIGILVDAGAVDLKALERGELVAVDDTDIA